MPLPPGAGAEGGRGGIQAQESSCPVPGTSKTGLAHFIPPCSVAPAHALTPRSAMSSIPEASSQSSRTLTVYTGGAGAYAVHAPHPDPCFRERAVGSLRSHVLTSSTPNPVCESQGRAEGRSFKALLLQGPPEGPRASEKLACSLRGAVSTGFPRYPKVEPSYKPFRKPK